MISKNINKLFYVKKSSCVQHSNVAIKSLTTINYDRLQCVNRNLDSKILHKNNFLIKDYNYRNSHLSIKPSNLYAEPTSYQGLKIKHTYNILAGSEIYSQLLTKPLSFNTDDIENIEREKILEKEWTNMNVTEILENYRLLSLHAFKNNEIFADTLYQDIIKIIIKKLPDFNDDQLHCLMDYLMLWKTNREDPVYEKFWKTLDKECLKRLPKWTIDKVLLVNDKFYLLRIPRSADFPFISLLKMGRKLKNLNRANLMHFSFLLNIIREIPLRIYELEYYSQKYVDELTIEELAILALTFKKYENSFKSTDFLFKIIEKLEKNLDSISDITLTAILEILKFKPDENFKKKLTVLLELLESQIPHRPMSVIGQIADMKRRVLLLNPNLISKLAERLEKDIKNASIKDIEKIVAALCTFNYNPKSDSVYSIVIDECLNSEHVPETRRFSKSFINMMANLVQVNFYSEKALNLIMNPEFIDLSCGSNNYNLNSQYFKIDYCIELDFPQYTGPRLSKDLVELQKRRYGALLRLKTKKDRAPNYVVKFKNDVIENCKIAVGSESMIYMNPLLPYYVDADVVIGINPETNEFIPTSEKFSEKPLGTLIRAPNDGNKWFTLVFGSVHNITRDDTYSATSMLTMHIRHLKIIGYTPVLIQYHKWETLVNNKEKQKYLMDRLYE